MKTKVDKTEEFKNKIIMLEGRIEVETAHSKELRRQLYNVGLMARKNYKFMKLIYEAEEKARK